MTTRKPRTNAKIKKGTTLENDMPTTNPMFGVFDWGQGGGYGSNGVAPLSEPFEFASNVSANLVSLQRVMLTYAYVLYGPLRTLVDQPVYDAFRGGFEIKTDEVDSTDIDSLNKEIKRQKLKNKLMTALRWGRLFGGAGLIINVDQDFKSPFSIDSVDEDSKLNFIVADRWELLWQGVPNTPEATFAYYPGTGYYTTREADANTRMNIAKIHQSRVCRILTDEAPSLARQRLQGWGMSIVEPVLRELNSYFKNQNVIFEFLDEAKVDLYKIKGFNAQVLSNLAQGKTAKRIQMANFLKNFMNALVMDTEDDYIQKQLSFGGLSEIMEQIRISMAAAVRMPMSKIFGLSSSGFSSGEDDLENYAAIVETQRDQAEESLEEVLPIIMKKVWGFVPDDWSISWQPVRTLKAIEQQQVLDSKFNRLSTLYSQGILTPQEYTAALKQEEILEMGTEVSKGADPTPVFSGLDSNTEEEIKKEESSKESKETTPKG